MKSLTMRTIEMKSLTMRTIKMKSLMMRTIEMKRSDDERKNLADESVLSVDQDVDRPSQEEGKT